MSHQETGYGMGDSGERELQPVSQITHPVSSKGFTLLELIVVISIISILIGAILSRIPFYQEQAEKAVMEQTVAAMQGALVMRTGSLMARGDVMEKGLLALANENPIGWLQQKPKNYAGEFFDPAPNAVKPGQWMFDLKSRDLIYVPERSEYFTPGKDGKKWARFHVKLEYEAQVRGGKKEFAAALFEPAEPYHWFE
jgi:prepilin-type N-terminal cleavage/methylation domain-containing protein